MAGFEYGDPGSDPLSGGYNLGSWTGSGTGMYVLPGEGGGERAETGLTVPTDNSGYIGSTGLPEGVTPGTPGVGWGMPGNFGAFLTDLQKGVGGLGGVLKNIFGGGYGDVTKMAAFGGLAALLNRMMQQKPDPVGYQYGVPRYTATRTQTPIAQQRPEGYRPGQGGISYFSPTQYKYMGYEPRKAEEFLQTPARALPPAAPPPAGGTGETNTEVVSAAHGGYMPGGIAMLAGGRYLRGPGDGVSDSIPAKFERSGQPARLADGEFVIDARTVSEIGNGSSEAGARKLYAMMDRVHAARKRAKRGKPSGADKFLPK